MYVIEEPLTEDKISFFSLRKSLGNDLAITPDMHYHQLMDLSNTINVSIKLEKARRNNSKYL